MDALIERLSPPQIVAVIAIIAGSIVALAMIVGITKYQLQSLTDETALKREQQQSEAALKQKIVERGTKAGETSLDALLMPELSATDKESEQLNEELAAQFEALELSVGAIEETLSRAMSAPPARKRTIINVIEELLEKGCDHAGILAAIRPLCGPPSRVEEKEPAVAVAAH